MTWWEISDTGARLTNARNNRSWAALETDQKLMQRVKHIFSVIPFLHLLVQHGLFKASLILPSSIPLDSYLFGVRASWSIVWIIFQDRSLRTGRVPCRQDSSFPSSPLELDDSKLLADVEDLLDAVYRWSMARSRLKSRGCFHYSINKIQQIMYARSKEQAQSI